MKVFFAGSPPSSALILELLTKQGIIPSLVITQPDRPQGRNRKIRPSEVAIQAEKLGIDTVKPEKLDEEFISSISEHGKPDFILVSAYGKILPSRLLELPSIAPINVHFSILPKYRGASPIQESLLNGDFEFGYSIMKMDAGLDTGPVYFSKKVQCYDFETKIDIEKKIAVDAATELPDILRSIASGNLFAADQENKNISLCTKVTKASGLITSDLSSSKINNMFRAYFNWPGIYFLCEGMNIKIHGLEMVSAENLPDFKGKKIIIYNNEIYFKTIDGAIVITYLQVPGKKAIPSSDFINSNQKIFEEL
jgi:methionyl-tRNA formyltransferase